ncbi:hypothetical protein F1880_005079 [Penicillium rolfsii]|nr:hypothetical protein F1880_005079 [Penicillium rolfsii]
MWSGPPKGHIEALEHRLQVTENALLKLLLHVSDAQLLEAFPPHSSFEGAGATYVPLARIQKEGIENWAQFPLNTVENIRKWQQVSIGQDTTGPKDVSTHPASSNGRKRKQLAIEEPKDLSFEEHSEISGRLNPPREREAWSSSPIAFSAAQKRPFFHVDAQDTPSTIGREPHEMSAIVDTPIHPSMPDDQALAAQTPSSWDGAPSLNFQQRFLW